MYGAPRGPEQKGYRKRRASDTKNYNLKHQNGLRRASLKELVKVPMGGTNRAGKTKTKK